MKRFCLSIGELGIMNTPFSGIVLLILLPMNGYRFIFNKDLLGFFIEGAVRRPLECFDPATNTMVRRPNARYCAYGVTYSEKKWSDVIFRAVKDTIVYTDNAPIEKATIALCSGLPAETVKYGGGWAEYEEQIRKQIFFACCTNCTEFMLPAEDLHLKLINLCVAQMPINRIYAIKYAKKVKDGKPHLYYREFYKLNWETEEQMKLKYSFESCFSVIFRLIPSMLNNYVCAAIAETELRSDHLEPASFEETGETNNYRGSVITTDRLKTVFYAGPVDEFFYRAHENTFCRNVLPKYSTVDSVCFVQLGIVKQIYCCCYGQWASVCQEKLSRVAIQRDDVDPLATEQRTCHTVAEKYSVANTADIEKLKKEFETFEESDLYYRKWITVDSLLSEFLGEQQLQRQSQSVRNTLPRRYCSMNITFYGDYIYVEGDLFHERLEVGGKKISECERNFNPDYRIEEIHRDRCFVTLSNVSICPSEAHSRVQMQKSFIYLSRFYCCCNHKPFCNQEANVFAWQVFRAPNRCQFNNDYQHMFNRFLRGRGSSANHTCLMHFANADSMEDMLPDDQKYSGGDDPHELLVIAGTSVFPIDFGYELMNDNECEYIESSVNVRHLRMQNCRNPPLLESDFLPLRLFVCECYTEVPLNRTAALASEGEFFCDAKFDIRRVFRMMSKLDEENRCVRLETASLRDIFERRNITTVPNTLSSVCYTSIGFENGRMVVTAGVAARKIVNKVGVHLDHIGYAMLSLSGVADAHCKSVDSKTFCFCRAYNRTGREEEGSPCNVEMKFVNGAIRNAIFQEARAISKNLTIYEAELKYEYFRWSLAKADTTKAKSCVRDLIFCIIKGVPPSLKVSCQCTDSLRMNKSVNHSFGYELWYGIVTKDPCVFVNGEIICYFKPSLKEKSVEEAADALMKQKEMLSNTADRRDHSIFTFLLIIFLSYSDMYTV